MTPPPISNIEHHFGDLPDPRSGDNIRHPVVNIITITICAVICGANSWVDVEMFGQAKKRWFDEFLDLKHGIPSDDTIGRFFRAVDPKAFEQRFRDWTRHICELVEGEVVAIDGKQLRRSKDGTLGKAGIYMVNVWATENKLSLAQQKVANHTNEITAIPQLLALLELDGQIVTIDAIGCQTGIVATLVDQNADYVIAAKGNQGTLLEDIEAAFETDDAQQVATHHKTVNKGHGRIDTRQCWVVDDPEIIAYINDYKSWTGLRSIVKVESVRHILLTDTIETETRYFISSLPADPQQLLHAIRAHWQVENSLHWVLDMAFREDESRVRKDHAPQNFAVLRQVALNLLRQDDSLQVGIAAKRKRAGWDEAYLTRILCAA
ncbi:MAG: ISAs1 family transposase [Chloroflexota bacterium]